VCLWEVAEGKLVQVLSSPEFLVTAIAFSPNGKWLAGGTHQGAICVWEAATGTLVQILQGHSAHVSAVAFTPDGKWLASGSRDKTVRLWSLNAFGLVAP